MKAPASGTRPITSARTVDLVTEYDKRSEAHVVAALCRRLSRRRSGGGGGRRPGAARRAGAGSSIRSTAPPTSRTACRSSASSIALEDAHGPLVGVVDAPALGWHFYAARGHGAFLVERAHGRAPPRRQRHRRAREPRCSPPAFPTTPRRARATTSPSGRASIPRRRALRRVGAAALDLCFVAAG